MNDTHLLLFKPDQISQPKVEKPVLLPPESDNELNMLRNHYHSKNQPVPGYENWCVWDEDYCSNTDCITHGCPLGG